MPLKKLFDELTKNWKGKSYLHVDSITTGRRFPLDDNGKFLYPADAKVVDFEVAYEDTDLLIYATIE